MNIAKESLKKEKKKCKKVNNLWLLGVGSIVAAVATTGVSLAIYHSSGDIYLDRSRPGFLPDEEEVEEEEEKQEEDYSFEKSGKITKEVLEEYLEKIEVEIRAIDAYEGPFTADVLSNERLGIPEE